MTRYHRRTASAVAAAVALVAGASVVAAQLEFSSASRQRGRATVEYRTDHIHVVAAYNYSQRNHDSRWIMIQTGISTTASTTIPRGAIALRTPAGRDIPLATQREFGADVGRIRVLLQNAQVVVHDVTSYFIQRDRTEDMRLFRLPFDDVVHDSIVVDRDRVAVGPLFFASPTGAWERGTYALVVEHPEGAAKLPIRLE